MLNISKHFNTKQLDLLNSIRIFLDDEKDYSDDELLDIHDVITDNYLTYGFDEKDDATELAKIYEEIIDIFYDDFDI